jgi:uncharacterized membrane protein
MEGKVSYQERRSILNLFSGILIAVIYSAYMIQRYPQADAYSPEVFQFWGAFFLILIGVSIVARIIIFILFAILNAIMQQEQEPDITDERDRLIELKSMRTGFYVFMIGFIVALVMVAAGQPPAVMFITLLCAGLASDMISTIFEFYFYRRGV